MRKLVRTVIINDEDEDEDDDEVNIHHRHHHVSTVLGKAPAPGGLGELGSGPRQGGRQLSITQDQALEEKAVGRLLWEQPHGRSQQTSGTWRRLLRAKRAPGTLLEVISNPEQPCPAAERAGGAGRGAELVPRIAWRWRSRWWAADGRHFSAAAAPSSPLHQGAGPNPGVTLSFLPAHRSPHRAEMGTRKRDLSCTPDARGSRVWGDAITATLVPQHRRKIRQRPLPGALGDRSGMGRPSSRFPRSSWDLKSRAETDIDYPWVEEPSSCRPGLPKG